MLAESPPSAQPDKVTRSFPEPGAVSLVRGPPALLAPTTTDEPQTPQQTPSSRGLPSAVASAADRAVVGHSRTWRTEAVLDSSAVRVVPEAAGQRDAVSRAVACDKPVATLVAIPR